MIELRRATAVDAPAVADVFLASFRTTYPSFRVVHTDDDVRDWIAASVIPETECWVAVDGETVVGMMGLTPGWIDHLYVAPDRLAEGIGGRLLELAMATSDGFLELWTFQVNDRARYFYERKGFEAVELTDGGGNEEREPDVRYAWSRERGGREAPAAPGA